MPVKPLEYEITPEKLIAKQTFLEDMDRLRSEDIVRYLVIKNDKISIYYKDGLHDVFDKSMLESVDRYKRDIPIGCQFTINPLSQEADDLKEFFSISIKDYKRGGFLDKELAIHRLAKKLKDEKFFRRRYPFKLLKADYLSIDSSVYDADGRVDIHPRTKRRYRGRFVQETFYNFDNERNGGKRGKSIDWVWVKPRTTTRIMRMLLSDGRNINYTNLLRKFMAISTSNRSCRTLRSPGFYMSLFEKMNIDKFSWIHDVDPVWWSKAIACSKMNFRYTYEDRKHDMTSNEYNNFLESIDVVPNTSYCDNDDVKADILMLDFNLEEFDHRIEKYTEHLGTKWKKIVYVSKEPTKDCVEIKPYTFMKHGLYFNILS